MARILTGVVEGLLQAGAALGLPRRALLEHAALDEAALLDRDATVPLRCQVAIAEAIVAARPSINLGLVILRRFQPNMFGALGYALANCSDLREALGTFVRYQSFVTDAMRWGRPAPNTVTLDLPPELGALGHPAEASLGMWVVLGRKLSRREWTPRALSFRHQAIRGDAGEHEALFGITPRFAAAHNRLELEPGTLDLPIVGAQRGLRGPLLRLLDGQMVTPLEPELVTKLRAEMRRRLPRGTSKDELARSLYMSPRTLTRRLRGVGTTYNTLLEDTRRTLALELLGDPQLAVYELAFLLGYSEPSTFHRAFRRWTGESPDAWRRARLSA